jgi:hypothetical protein
VKAEEFNVVEFKSAKVVFIVLILLGLGIISYYATNSLFMINSGFGPSAPNLLAFQSMTSGIKVLSPALKKGCNQLKLDSSKSIVPTFAGLPATLVYACGKAGHPAFSTVKSSSGNTLSATPIFVRSFWLDSQRWNGTIIR